MHDARHLSKYVFPRMYALPNAFTLPASSNYKTYIVPNFEDREAEIKVCRFFCWQCYVQSEICFLPVAGEMQDSKEACFCDRTPGKADLPAWQMQVQVSQRSYLSFKGRPISRPKLSDIEAILHS